MSENLQRGYRDLKQQAKATGNDTPTPSLSIASIVNRIKIVAQLIERESEDRAVRWAVSVKDIAESLLQLNLNLKTGDPLPAICTMPWQEALTEIKNQAERICTNDAAQCDNAGEIKTLVDQARTLLFGDLPV